MPNIKSAKKRVKVNKAKTLRNKMVNSDLKTAIKKANTAVETGADDREAVVKEAVIAIDKACSKGILHKNTAARKKSQIVKRVNG